MRQIFAYAIVVVLVGAALFVSRVSSTTSLQEPMSPQVTKWYSLIQQEGPLKAHDDFVFTGRDEAPLTAHMDAHAFGEALYRAGGSTYLVYCGAGEFLFGCYHQFIAAAATARGPDIIADLIPLCQQSDEPYSCIHGIGHGLMAAYGDGQDALPTSLQQCKNLFSKDSEQQICADGVFMEYNLHMSTSADAMTDHRALTDANVYTPCTDTDPTVKDQCIFELPLWWYYSLRNSQATSTLFAQIGSWCDNAPSTISKKACFTGIGFPVAIETGSDARQYNVFCSTATEAASDKTLCVAGARSCFYSDPIHVVWKNSLYK